MLLTVTTTHSPAAELGFLLHKDPARVQSFELAFGRAHVFYPEVGSDRCTAALLLDVDPIGLSRRDSAAAPRQPYVNDRPYVASSFLSVAIAQVLGSALAGRSKERPALAEARIPLVARVAALPCRGGEQLARRLFEPLGYDVDARRHPLDPEHPEWEPGRLFSIELRAVTCLRDLLTHLYVLVPVLDDEKHYWVGDDEVEKLLRHGERWLGSHPDKELIAERYLKHRKSLAREALARLAEEDEPRDPDAAAASHAAQEDTIERRVGLNEQRLGAVLAALKGEGARRVVDLGCGEGRLLRVLLGDPWFQRIIGVDVSHRALEVAADRLNLDDLPPAKRDKIQLLHGSLVYRDERIGGLDAAALVEVIEHLDPSRLEALTRVVFEHARPTSVVVTTPNAEHNVRFDNLAAGGFRHPDHRFEWTRAELEAWARAVGQRHGYEVRFLPIGDVDPALGAPTQMAIFRRNSGETRSAS